MKEVKYYIAEDGTRFDTESECNQYESTIESEVDFDCVEFLDADKDLLKLNVRNASNIGFARFIVVKDAEAFKTLYNYLHRVYELFDIDMNIMMINSGDILAKAEYGGWYNLTTWCKKYIDDLNGILKVIQSEDL